MFTSSGANSAVAFTSVPPFRQDADGYLADGTLSRMPSEAVGRAFAGSERHLEVLEGHLRGDQRIWGVLASSLQNTHLHLSGNDDVTHCMGQHDAHCTTLY